MGRVTFLILVSCGMMVASGVVNAGEPDLAKGKPEIPVQISKKIKCEADGPTLSQSDSELRMAKADLSFNDMKDAEGLRILKNIRGTVMVTASTKAEFGDGELNRETADYVEDFSIETLSENPKYKPTRYKGFSQFKDFDASDMWGSFILDKDTNQDSFEAHYIFQAGDHMGGTLHMSCEVTAQ